MSVHVHVHVGRFAFCLYNVMPVQAYILALRSDGLILFMLMFLNPGISWIS